jgi:hypothetical protein
MRIGVAAHEHNSAAVNVHNALYSVIRPAMTGIIDDLERIGGVPTARLFVNAMLHGTPEHTLQIYEVARAAKSSPYVPPEEVYVRLQPYVDIASTYVQHEREVVGYIDAAPTVSPAAQLPEAVGTLLETFADHLAAAQALTLPSEPVVVALTTQQPQLLQLGILVTRGAAEVTAAIATGGSAGLALKYGDVRAIRATDGAPAPSPSVTPAPVWPPAPNCWEQVAAALPWVGLLAGTAFVAWRLWRWYSKPSVAGEERPTAADILAKEDTPRSSVGKSDVASSWDMNFQGTVLD